MRTRFVLLLAMLLSLGTASLAAVNGTVINSNGQTVAGVKVALFAPETMETARARLLSKTPERSAIASGTTDGSGRFAVELPKDVAIADLRITAAGYAPEAMRVTRDEDLAGVLVTNAETKRGTVTAVGKPVAGATVIWMGSAAEAIATTDAEGHYSVPDPTNWASRVVIWHPDYALLEEFTGPFSGEARKGVDRTLSIGVLLKGRVVGEDGQTPVAKATLALDSWPAATAGEDGTFTLGHAPAKWAMLTARSESLVGVKARAGNGPVTVRVGKGATIAGMIRNAKTQKAVAGVEVLIMSGTQNSARPAIFGSTFSDTKGNYVTPAVPAGSYEVSANAPGYSSSSASVSLTKAQKAQKPLAIVEDGVVSGSVLDEAKRGVGGVALSQRPVSRDPMAMGRPRMRFDRTAVSTPDGRFVLRTQPDVDVQIDGVKRGMPPAKSASLRLAPGERKSGVILTIVRGVAVAGRVVDQAGKPLGGASVLANASEGSGSGPGMMIRRTIGGMMRGEQPDTVHTGSDGTFSLRLIEGTYDLTIKHEGYAAKTVRALQVSATAKPFDVTLNPGVEISGRVTRAGNGVDGVNVSAISEGSFDSAVTGPDGTFRISDLSPGQIMVNFRKQDDFIQQIRSVKAPAQDVNLEVPPGGRISGRVTDKSSHQPVTSFRAGINTSRSGGGMAFVMPPQLRSFTSDDGSFTLENVPPGQTQLVVNAPGYTAGRVPNLTVEDGKTIADVVVEMDTGVRLAGRITGPDGAPVNGASVRPDNGGGRGMRLPSIDPGATTDTNGDFAIEAIEPGEKTFQIVAPGLLPESKTITLSNKETRLDVQLSAGARVSGQVVTESGVPVSDASVSARSASSTSFGGTTRTDNSGVFRFEDLAPGHYTFSASRSGYADGVTRDFDIMSGAPLQVVLKTGAVIYGHVAGLSEAELQHSSVTAVSPNGSASASTDSSGNYRIEGTPAGVVHVEASTSRGFGDSRNTQPKTVQVDAGSSLQVDLEFNSQTVITGRVTKNGQAVTNAVVSFQPRGSVVQTSARTTTDANGGYSVSGLADSQYQVAVVELQRMAPYSSTYTVHGSGTYDIDMKSAALRGRVVDTAGEPLADAHVELRKSDSTATDFMSLRGATTDAGGNFSIDSVSPGSYNAGADKDGYGHQILPVTVGDSAPDALEFKLARNDGIRIRVVDARDNSLLNAYIRALDAQGRVVYDEPFRAMGLGPADGQTLALAPGQYRVSISAMNYATRSMTMTSPSLQQTIGLTPGGSIVIKSKSTSPRRARMIDGDGQTYNRGYGDGSFTIDADPGGAQLRNVAPGAYVIQLMDGSQVLGSKSVVVAEGQTVQVDL